MKIDEIINKLYIGMEIRKPNKITEIIKKSDTSIYYRIGQVNSKKVDYSELELALNEINTNGYIDSVWFKRELPKVAKSKPCNFTTMGGIFVTLGICDYKRGRYYSNNYELQN